MNHIFDDDGSYAPFVSENIQGVNSAAKQGWLKNMVSKFFPLMNTSMTLV